MAWFVGLAIAYGVGYLSGYSAGKDAVMKAGQKFFGMFRPGGKDE